MVQLKAHQEVNKLFDHDKSSFRKLNSYETAMSKVVIEGQELISYGKLVMMIMLDLSSAFDNID